MSIERFLKSPMADTWASVLEAGIVFVLKMDSEKDKSLMSMLRSLLDVQYEKLLFDLALVGMSFISSVLLILCVTTLSIRCFNILSYLLLVGASLHLAMRLFNLGLAEYLCYVVVLSIMGLVLGSYHGAENGASRRHPFLSVADAIREHAADFAIILCAYVIKAFMFIWFFSGSQYRLTGIKALLFTFFEFAAISSLLYNMRVGVVLLMTVGRTRNLHAYTRLVVRRIRLIGTICLAGLMRPFVCIIYFSWTCLNVLGATRQPGTRYTLRSHELSVFYSVLNDVSLSEGRRIAGNALEGDKTFAGSESFRSILGMFVPYCFSLIYILSSSVGVYARYLPKRFIYLCFVLLHLMLLEFLYSVATLRSIMNRQKNESIS